MAEMTDPFGMPLGYWQKGIGLDVPTVPIPRAESELARKTYAYQVWRKAVLKRDGYVCRECGEDDERAFLHTHHIMPWAEFPELRLNLDNGITLCQGCHHRTHKEMRLDAQ